MAPMGPGFRFHRTDEELVVFYLNLKRKITGNLSRYDHIAMVDVYKLEPWDLPPLSKLKTKDLEWYFFSVMDRKYGNGSKTNHATEKGYWKTTGKDRLVAHGDRTVGMKKTLVYHAPALSITDCHLYQVQLPPIPTSPRILSLVVWSGWPLKGDQASIIGGAINFVKELEQRHKTKMKQQYYKTQYYNIQCQNSLYRSSKITYSEAILQQQKKLIDETESQRSQISSSLHMVKQKAKFLYSSPNGVVRGPPSLHLLPRYPDEAFTGFCPACLCKRLVLLDPNNNNNNSLATARKPPSTAVVAALKALFRPRNPRRKRKLIMDRLIGVNQSLTGGKSF
ncbi:protein FEZ-like [Vigna umbellata]|uniref:protein FEZ-like n=1 Tax=Vigna umbellata TaxID=87088 RepID=UPI001F5EDBE3|nr:protein FEZ-like [Vigna umbellata]